MVIFVPAVWCGVASRGPQKERCVVRCGVVAQGPWATRFDVQQCGADGR